MVWQAVLCIVAFVHNVFMIVDDAVCVGDDVDMTMLWSVVNIITDSGCE